MERDIIVTCPYNKAHRIRRYKLMSHIVKCKKQYGTNNKVTCPLNSSHVIDHNDIRDHLASCSNLSSLIQETVEENEVMAPIMDANAHKLEENWDESPEVPSYDAMAHSASRKVLRCVNGLTKSERVKYRMSERERIANLNATSSTVRRPEPLREETIPQIAVRPPSDVAQAEDNTKASQQRLNRNAQKQNSNESSTASVTNEFRDTFQKTLYNELLPDCKPNGWRDTTYDVIDETQYVKSEDKSLKTKNSQQELLEHSVASNDTSYKSFNYSNSSLSARRQFHILLEKEGRKEKSLSSMNKTQEVKSKKKQENGTEVDAHYNILSANNSMKETKDTENTHDASASSERITDKLLTLMMDKSEKIGLAEKTKGNGKNDEKDESKNLELGKWEKMMCKLSDQLNHLTNAQSIAAEQSARLAKEVNDLKLKSCCNTQSSSILNNSRCAANFTQQMLNSKDHNVSKEASTALENTPSSYSVNKDNDMFNLTDDSKFPKLKTPKDFSYC